MTVLDVITIFLGGVISTLFYEYTHDKKIISKNTLTRAATLIRGK